jgi:methylated-DNA-[protein]-cysteine S-methyltransferase
MAGKEAESASKKMDTYPGMVYSVFETDWGWMAAAATRRGLVALTLPGVSEFETFASINRLNPGGRENNLHFESLAETLRMYFRGARLSFDELQIDVSGAAPFFQKAWAFIRQIPYGETRSYSWVASGLGCAAFRAVGQAMSQNPLPLVVPCHRVIYSAGTIGGYGGGLNMKRRLLTLEGLSIPDNTRKYLKD